MASNQTPIVHALLHTLQASLGIDILFESYVGLLVKGHAFDIEDIQVIPSSHSRRGFSNDVLSIDTFDKEWEIPEDGTFPAIIQVYTSRSSLLDYLPESYIINPYDRAERTGNQKDRIAEFKKVYKERYQSALQFFRPLEVEINRWRIGRELNEVFMLETFKGIIHELWKEEVVWQILVEHHDPANSLEDQLTPGWLRFFKTIHLSSHIIGDIQKVSRLVAFLLQEKVSIYSKWTMRPERITNPPVTLGTALLGQQLYLGSVVYTMVLETHLLIHDLTPETFYELTDPATEKYKLVQYIAKYYFPIDTEVVIDYELKEEEAQFALLPQSYVAGTVLGHMTRI